MYRSPALASAYDYYPFGMLMPDRYVSDTSQQCVTLTQTKWVTTWVNSCWDVSRWVWPGYQVYGSGYVYPRDADVYVYLANPGDAVSFSLSGVPDVQQEITLQVSSLSGSAVMEAFQEIGGLWVSMGGIPLVYGRNTLKVIPSQMDYRVHIKGPGSVIVERLCAKVPSLSQESMLVDVCDDDGDRYRFGFNGQEKVNEWAGIGNFMDFGARGYDSRVARFPTVDPLKFNFPGYSPYIFALNRPIDGYDFQGMRWENFNPKNVGVVVFGGVYIDGDARIKRLPDPHVKKSYESAIKAGLNVIVTNSWVELLSDLEEKNKKFHNLYFGGHGAASGDALTFFGWGFNSNLLLSNAEPIEAVGTIQKILFYWDALKAQTILA